jgi:hypothetical protein
MNKTIHCMYGYVYKKHCRQISIYIYAYTNVNMHTMYTKEMCAHHRNTNVIYYPQTDTLKVYVMSRDHCTYKAEVGYICVTRRNDLTTIFRTP